MLISTEHEISTAHKKTGLSCFIHLDGVFILLINVKMPTIVGVLTFVSRINFMHSCELSMKIFYNIGGQVMQGQLRRLTNTVTREQMDTVLLSTFQRNNK